VADDEGPGRAMSQAMTSPMSTEANFSNLQNQCRLTGQALGFT